LVKQWQDEITKHTNGKLKVFMFTTLEDLKSTTYRQIIDSGMQQRREEGGERN
jgi:hypothetical protein